MTSSKVMTIQIQKSKGFTLIELLVSMGLGIFFLGIAMSFLLSSRVAHSTQDVNSRLQENARFAMDELASSIRMASYVDLMTRDAEIPPGQFYAGACGSFDPCTADGGGTTPDRIAVLMNPPPDDGTDEDCIGLPLDVDTETAAISMAAYVYMIGDDGGVNSLMCQTFLVDEDGVATAVNATPQVLVSGIDNLQVLYGVTDVENVQAYDTQIQRYINADDVGGLDVPEGANTPWVDIAAVRIALLASSGLDDTSDTQASRTFKLLDAPSLNYTDKSRRQIFTTTVTINNARS
ncbi:MAG: PilW family protein [Pseudomonadales bacterium]